VAIGGLEAETVRAQLFVAAEACGLVAEDGANSVRATIESGGRAGLAKPRQISQGQQSTPCWPDVTKEGSPRRTYRNARAAIEALGIICLYDEFHDRMLVGGHVIHQWAGELSDAVTFMLRQVIIDSFELDLGKEHVLDAATALCLQNRFDPVVDYLNGLTWDGTKRLDKWLTT